MLSEHEAGNEIVEYLSRASFTTKEALSFCYTLNEMKKNCTEILNRIITEYGICYAFNMQGYHSIFNDGVQSEDFNLFKRQTIRNAMNENSKYFSDDKRGREDVEWTLHNGYTSDNDDAFPMRVISENSVKFILKIPKSETNNFCPLLHNSYKVIFHMPNEIPTKFHDYVYSTIGSQFFISMTAKHYMTDESLRKYSPEMRGCYIDGERKLKFFRSYTKAHCDTECLTNYTLHECGCVKFSMPRLSATPVCGLSIHSAIKRHREPGQMRMSRHTFRATAIRLVSTSNTGRSLSITLTLRAHRIRIFTIETWTISKLLFLISKKLFKKIKFTAFRRFSPQS